MQFAKFFHGHCLNLISIFFYGYGGRISMPVNHDNDTETTLFDSCIVRHSYSHWEKDSTEWEGRQEGNKGGATAGRLYPNARARELQIARRKTWPCQVVLILNRRTHPLWFLFPCGVPDNFFHLLFHCNAMEHQLMPQGTIEQNRPASINDLCVRCIALFVYHHNLAVRAYRIDMGPWILNSARYTAMSSRWTWCRLDTIEYDIPCLLAVIQHNRPILTGNFMYFCYREEIFST